MLNKIIFTVFFLCVNLLHASNSFLVDQFELTKLTMVGAHNAPMSTTNGWKYYQQDHTIEYLFEQAGVRFVKVPIQWYYSPNSAIGAFNNFVKGISSSSVQPVISIAHEYPGDTNCKLTMLQLAGSQPEPAINFLRSYANLAIKYPNEIMVLKLESYLLSRSTINGTASYTNAKVISVLTDMLKLSGIADRAYPLTPGEYPTLGQIRNSGKNILVFIDDSTLAGGAGYLNYYNTFFNETDWQAAKFAACKFINPIDSHARLTELGMNNETSIPNYTPQGVLISIANALGINTGVVTSSNYKNVNSASAAQARITTCIQANAEVPNVYPNVLSSDFVEIGDLLSVANARNIQQNTIYLLHPVLPTH